MNINSDHTVPLEIAHRGSSNFKTKFVGGSGTHNKSLEFGTMINGQYSIDSIVTTTASGNLVLNSAKHIELLSATVIKKANPSLLSRGELELIPNTDLLAFPSYSTTVPSLEVHGDVVLGESTIDTVTIRGVLSAHTVNLTASTIIADGNPRPHTIQNITVANLRVSNVLFEEGRLTEVMSALALLFSSVLFSL